MKTILLKGIFILALLITGLTSCDDESNITINTIEGEWTWKSTSGGLLGLENNADELGVTIKYTFATNQSFTESVNDVQTRTGTYFLSEENDNVPSGNNDNPFLNLSFDSNYEPDGNEQYVLYPGGYQIGLSENTLTLDNGVAADGFFYTFEK